MDGQSTLYSSILLLGAAHGGFLAIALLNVRSGNKAALRLLGLLTITFAIDLATNYLIVSGLVVRFPRLAFVESVAVFLYGPLLYFYVCALTARSAWTLRQQSWLHLLPLVLCALLLIPLLRLYDAALVEVIYERSIGEVGDGGWATGRFLLDVLPRLLIAFYLFLGFRRLMQHGRNIRDTFSSIEHINLNWLRNLLIAWLMLWAMYFVALAFGGRGPVENALNVAMVFVVYALGYLGLRQPEIFTQSDLAVRKESTVLSKAATNSGVSKPKYEKSALDTASSEALLTELETIMRNEQPYLDSTLTLSQLADQLGISSNYLSQVINQRAGSNFFDFVNGYRIETAKSLLADPANAKMNVLTVAMDSGFNSKSAFYTAFKHHTSETPSQFRRKKVS